jgi:hypothetical protein
MKAKVIFSLSLLIPFALLFIYVLTTATDLVFRDDMYLIKGGPIENYLNGTLTFSDLWRSTDSTRILGYNILMLANIKWFSLNSKIIALLVPFFMMASAILIYTQYQKSLTPNRSQDFIAATFLLISFIIFNIIQWESLVFGNGLTQTAATPFFIASFISLELFISKGTRKYLLMAVMLPSLAMLVFGGRLCIVFLPTLGITFLIYLITHKFKLTKDFWCRAFLISVFLSAIAFIYAWGIHHNEYSDSSYLATEAFAHPFDAIQFLLAAFGSSVVGIDAFFACDYFSFHTIVLLGLAVVIFDILAMIFFFSSKMYEKTFLPLFLIMQTFIYLGFMTIVRFGLGLDYGMASRYTYVSIYGIMATAWIFIYMLASTAKLNIFFKSAIFTGLSIIFSGLLLTSIIIWHFQPHQKAFFEQLQKIAIRVDTATEEELSRFGERPEQVRESLLLLREHKLNAYREKLSNRE